MNDLYKSGTSMLKNDHCVDNHLLNEEIEKLKHENKMLRMNNDDVCKQFSKERFQLIKRLEWCQSQTNAMELKLQNHEISNSCQFAKPLSLSKVCVSNMRRKLNS
jgi:hypothetical protein